MTQKWPKMAVFYPQKRHFRTNILYLAEILPHFNPNRNSSLLMQIIKTVFEGYIQVLKDQFNKISTGVDMSNLELKKISHIEREANWISTSLCGNFIGSDDEFFSEKSKASQWIHDILFYNGYYDVIRILKVEKPEKLEKSEKPETPSKNLQKRDVSWLLDDPYDYSDFLKKPDYIKQRKSSEPSSVSSLVSFLNRIIEIEPSNENFEDDFKRSLTVNSPIKNTNTFKSLVRSTVENQVDSALSAQQKVSKTDFDYFLHPIQDLWYQIRYKIDSAQNQAGEFFLLIDDLNRGALQNLDPLMRGLAPFVMQLGELANILKLRPGQWPSFDFEASMFTAKFMRAWC